MNIKQSNSQINHDSSLNICKGFCSQRGWCGRGYTLCSSSSFCPKGEERSKIPPEANETWKQFVYKQKTEACHLSLPIIILYFLFVLYNVQDEKQVILLGNSQRCYFIDTVPSLLAHSVWK